MPEVPLVLNAVDANGRGLRVTFSWRLDRFAHSIALVDGPREWTLLQSMEGAADHSWPASPPLQQLVTQARNAKSPAILGVGMSGKNHWSMSAEAEPRHTSLRFDVACRIKQRHGVPGSSFRAKVPPIPVIGPPGAVAEAELSVGSLRCRLAVEPSEDGLQGTLRFDQHSVTIRSAEVPDAYPWTARWTYRFYVPV